jgi:signal peptidase I
LSQSPYAYPAEEPAPRPGCWARARSLAREIIETLVLTALIFLALRFAFQNFRIEGHSMEPSLHEGQFLIIQKLEYRFHSPERGDVIVFRSPQNVQKDFIKRIIGLPGEEVQIQDGQVTINGQPLEEPYVAVPAGGNYGPQIVGPDQYFVLGDNRNNSSDSRSWGMLPVANIIGKAWVSYWPPPTWGPVPHYSYASA